MRRPSWSAAVSRAGDGRHDEAQGFSVDSYWDRWAFSSSIRTPTSHCFFIGAIQEAIHSERNAALTVARACASRPE